MTEDHKSRGRNWRAVLAGLFLLGLSPVLIGEPRTASAAEASVGLGAASPFAVLAGAGVTNTGMTIVNGNLGTCPTPAITGSPTVNGTTHANDAVACKAQDDLTIAYDDAAGRAPNTTYAGPTDLGGLTLVPGVYKSPTSFAITGTLTLDAGGDPSAVFIFQAGSTLITSVNSKVLLINGAQASNVFWQVGSSATLNTGTTFVGTVMALTSISVKNRTTVDGRVLARNGAVTLDNNFISRPEGVAPTTTTVAPSTTTTVAPTTTTTTVPTTTTGPAATTTTTTSPALGEDNPTTTTAGPEPTLPPTGSPLGGLLLLAASAVALGVATTLSSRRSDRN